MPEVPVWDIARSIAAYGLPTARAVWPSQPLDDGAWAHLMTVSAQQRLQALLFQAVSAGVLPVTADQRAQASRQRQMASLIVLMLESATLRTILLLESAGVTPRLLKGPAVAHLDYADPGLRLFSDIDLIVPAEQFDRTVEVLVQAGHRRRHPQPRPGFDRRFSKGTSFHTPDGLEVDLHRTFVMGPFGLRMKLQDVWDDGRSFQLGGRQVTALSDEVRFLHACFHTALGNIEPRLVPQRDVAQMLIHGRLEDSAVGALAERWGAQPVLTRALSLAFDTLRVPDTPLVSSARARRLSAPEERELRVYTDAGAGYAGKSLAAVRALPRWRDRLAFIYALAFPQHSYIVDRSAIGDRRWRRGLQAALRLARRA